MFLVYEGTSKLQMEAYTDSDFQSNVDDRKSTSGYVFTLNEGGVSWSCKQSTTADSITKAEYIAAAEAAKEAIWMIKFISDLRVFPTIALPVALYCDNNRAITQAKEPRSHQNSKHIERRLHKFREYISLGEVSILKVVLTDNIADPTTQLQLDRHLQKMGIRYMANWL
ncbi:hypothetical protein L3X38_011918 [Prunus dulcis]|uniref:Transposable element protein n=1 Tax=Prunus dulcis TaxID=3755 RepID=A0AAD4WKS0_PRUDU|nr:hypothetical protein L3X38_011918 [Prunus dulcis]